MRHSLGARVAQVSGIGLALAGVVFLEQPKSLAAHGAEPTYAEDVAPILYKNCASCHRPGGLGPFSVLDYDSTVVNADEIHDAVAQGQMPP